MACTCSGDRTRPCGTRHGGSQQVRAVSRRYREQRPRRASGEGCPERQQDRALEQDVRGCLPGEAGERCWAAIWARSFRKAKRVPIRAERCAGDGHPESSWKSTNRPSRPPPGRNGCSTHEKLPLFDGRGMITHILTIGEDIAAFKRWETRGDAREGECRGRVQGQRRIPREHEPRDPDADERHHRHDRPCAADGTHRPPAEVSQCREDRRRIHSWLS